MSEIRYAKWEDRKGMVETEGPVFLSRLPVVSPSEHPGFGLMSERDHLGCYTFHIYERSVGAGEDGLYEWSTIKIGAGYPPGERAEFFWGLGFDDDFILTMVQHALLRRTPAVERIDAYLEANALAKRFRDEAKPLIEDLRNGAEGAILKSYDNLSDLFTQDAARNPDDEEFTEDQRDLDKFLQFLSDEL